MFTYPSSALDQPAALLDVLGSFWRDVYSARDILAQYVAARLEAERQVVQDAQDLAVGAGVATTPVYRTQRWHVLTLRESEQKPYLARYGDPDLFFNGSLQYGVQKSISYHAWAIPSDLRDAAAVTNRLADPASFSGLNAAEEVWMASNVDFRIDLDQGLLVLNVDPFTDDRFSTRIDEDGDKTAVVWLHQALFNNATLYERYGFMLGLWAEGSSAYRKLLQAMLTTVTAGSTRATAVQAIEAITGIELAQSGETVELVQQDRRKLFVVTDKASYGVSSLATPLVAVGDTVKRGYALTDALRIFDLASMPTSAELPSLVLDATLLRLDGLADTLEFTNADTPLVVSEDTDGFTRVEFELQGSVADKTLFWDTVHANGRAQGQTLAHLLDQRVNKTGEPQASNLPVTINPLEFLITNVLRGNAIVVRVREDCVGEDAVGLDYRWVLRNILPPHVAAIWSIY